MPQYETPDGVMETMEWGDGPELVILLHATASGPRALTPFAEYLARPGRRIIAPLLNNYGRIAPLAGEALLQSHMAITRACLELHDAQRRIVFGHSMGGMIGLLSAMHSPAPDALILYEPIVIAALDSDNPEDRQAQEWGQALVETFAGHLSAGDPETGVAGFVDAWNDMSWQDIPETARTRLIAAAAFFIAETRAVQARALSADDFFRVTAPVLLLQGTTSPALVNRVINGLLRRLPRVRRTILAERGHLGPVLAPVPVAGAVEDFLRRTLPNGAA